LRTEGAEPHAETRKGVLTATNVRRQWATDFANKPIPEAPDQSQNNSADPQTQQKMIQDTTTVGAGAILLRLLLGALAF
jgi:hypothetical protein